MKNILFPVLFFFTFFSFLSAQDIVEVKKVDFKKTKDKTKDYWIQMEIELFCGPNTLATARHKDYTENVKVKVYLAYERDASARLYDYYTSEVEVVIMEANEDYNVYFYLPGLIVERDRLNQPEPAFYHIEISVGGTAQAPKGGSRAISDQIKNLQVLQSFLTQAEAGSAVNDSILMPIYYAPNEFWGQVDDLPLFLRRDVRD